VLRECSKKSVQQGRSYFEARSVPSVREHGKIARTPLVAFFNIPFMKRCPILLGIERRLVVEMDFFIDGIIG